MPPLDRALGFARRRHSDDAGTSGRLARSGLVPRLYARKALAAERNRSHRPVGPDTSRGRASHRPGGDGNASSACPRFGRKRPPDRPRSEGQAFCNLFGDADHRRRSSGLRATFRDRTGGGESESDEGGLARTRPSSFHLGKGRSGSVLRSDSDSETRARSRGTSGDDSRGGRLRAGRRLGRMVDGLGDGCFRERSIGARPSGRIDALSGDGRFDFEHARRQSQRRVRSARDDLDERHDGSARARAGGETPSRKAQRRRRLKHELVGSTRFGCERPQALRPVEGALRGCGRRARRRTPHPLYGARRALRRSAASGRFCRTGYGGASHRVDCGRGVTRPGKSARLFAARACSRPLGYENAHLRRLGRGRSRLSDRTSARRFPCLGGRHAASAYECGGLRYRGRRAYGHDRARCARPCGGNPRNPVRCDRLRTLPRRAGPGPLPSDAHGICD